jgi:hypothetical protein
VFVCAQQKLVLSVSLAQLLLVLVGVRHRLWLCVDDNNNLGVFVTREHVRHNKSGIAHRGRTGINH